MKNCLKYLYYWILSHEGQSKIDAIAKGTAQKAVPIASIKLLKLRLPPIDIQRRIADILSAYDNLIENNRKQIKLLEEAAQRLYKEWFVDLRFPGWESVPVADGVPEGWDKDHADSFFDITIGKTPPRVEKGWFVKSGKGVPWVSIADMGNAGMFVFDSSENITREAVKKHNIKIIPDGTVLLSFKLTVGRVSIATHDMTTNEAIAHFKIADDILRGYTYLYLKSFHYDELGNTSGISKAVNSKIIKAMPFVMPSYHILSAFSKLITPILDEVRNKQLSNRQLSEARDRLLPKLMSGDLEEII